MRHRKRDITGRAKAFVELDLSLHLAGGADWLGHKVSAGGPNCGRAVVYVAVEGGAGISNRLEAIRRENTSLFEDA